MIEELKKLRELTETLIGNGYLKDQAEEWEYALDAIPDYVYIINNSFEIKFTNRALSEKLNLSKEKLFGKISYEVIRGSEGGISPKAWSDWVECEPLSISSELYIDNLYGWFNLTKSPIYTNVGKLIGFICVLQDITDTKRAISKIQYAEAALKESKTKYKLIVDNVLDIVWTTDIELNLTFVNPASKVLLGYLPEELVGRNLSEFTSKTDFEFVLPKFKDAVIMPELEYMKFDSYMTNKDNKQIHVNVNAKPLRDTEGNVVGFQGITRVIG